MRQSGGDATAHEVRVRGLAPGWRTGGAGTDVLGKDGARGRRRLREGARRPWEEDRVAVGLGKGRTGAASKLRERESIAAAAAAMAAIEKPRRAGGRRGDCGHREAAASRRPPRGAGRRRRRRPREGKASPRGRPPPGLHARPTQLSKVEGALELDEHREPGGGSGTDAGGGQRAAVDGRAAGQQQRAGTVGHERNTRCRHPPSQLTSRRKELFKILYSLFTHTGVAHARVGRVAAASTLPTFGSYCTLPGNSVGYVPTHNTHGLPPQGGARRERQRGRRRCGRRERRSGRKRARHKRIAGARRRGSESVRRRRRRDHARPQASGRERRSGGRARGRTSPCTRVCSSCM